MKNYEIRVFPKLADDGSTYWTACYPSVPGCVGGGDTVEEAISDAQENLQVYLEFLQEEKRKIPEVIIYLGKVLPYAIMGMLVIYCLRGITTGGAEAGIAQMIACAVVVVLHLWKRNTLISIIGGTAVYMVLVQVILG